MVGQSAAQIAASLIQGDEGAKWASKRTGWDAEGDVPVCSWEGITCTDNAITSINLNGLDLRATIPPELGRLKSLRELDLGKNDLYGSIPTELASLRNLETLNVGENGNIVGTMPTLANSPNLQTLVLQTNRLHGSIPDALPRHNPNLKVLDISHNEIGGTISSSFVGLHSLAYCDLSYNKLQGSLPYRLGDMKELKGLFLNNNDLMGTIPSSLSRGDSKLVQLFLEGNRLSGTIPAGLADIPRLTDLFVDGNKFTGTVPADLCKLNLNEEFFAGRTLNATDGLGQERDGCNSISCPVDSLSKEGVYPCYECGQQGFSPYLGHNTRCYHLDERIILDRLYAKTDGPNWHGGAGWAVANAPKCGHEGVGCNGAGKIVNITLAGMNLKGTIPEELGYLRHLQRLNLSNNALTGYLPSDLRWAPLESLDVSGNKLEGFVPPMLCLTGDINGNGENGDFNCDVISCSAGTWSPIGRATHVSSRHVKKEYECQPCPGSAMYLGSKVCPVVSVDTITNVLKEPIVADGAIIAALVLLAVALSASASILCARVRRCCSKSKPKSSRSVPKHEYWYGDADGDEDEDDDQDSYPYSSKLQNNLSREVGKREKNSRQSSLRSIVSSLRPTGDSRRDVTNTTRGTNTSYVATARSDPEVEEELWCLSDVPRGDGDRNDDRRGVEDYSSKSQKSGSGKVEERKERHDSRQSSLLGIVSSLRPTLGSSRRDVASTVTDAGTGNMATVRHDPEEEEELWCISDVPRATDEGTRAGIQTDQREDEGEESDDEEEELWFLNLPKVT